MTGMRLGFVGLGNMGEPMAHRLAVHGPDLTVFDPRPGAVDRCERAGALVADSLTEVALACDRVAICVGTDRQVLEVVDQLLGDPHSRVRIVIIHSTVAPSTIEAVSELAEPHGVSVVDAPVSGGADASERGALTMLAGGSPATVDEVLDVLQVCGSVHHVGAVGAAAALKLVNNVLALVGLQAAIEARKLANAFSLDLDVVSDVVRVSTGDTWSMRNVAFWQGVIHEHPQGNTDAFYEFVRKDLGLALEAGTDRGIELPLVAAAYELGPVLYREFWAREPDE